MNNKTINLKHESIVTANQEAMGNIIPFIHFTERQIETLVQLENEYRISIRWSDLATERTAEVASMKIANILTAINNKKVVRRSEKGMNTVAQAYRAMKIYIEINKQEEPYISDGYDTFEEESIAEHQAYNSSYLD